MNYKVIRAHKSNYPNPITIKKGARLRIGDKYNGPENWENWIYCYTLDSKNEGWLPKAHKQRVPYFLFNFLYRKFGKATEKLCKLITYEQVGRIAERLSYHL